MEADPDSGSARTAEEMLGVSESSPTESATPEAAGLALSEDAATDASTGAMPVSPNVEPKPSESSQPSPEDEPSEDVTSNESSTEDEAKSLDPISIESEQESDSVAPEPVATGEATESDAGGGESPLEPEPMVPAPICGDGIVGDGEECDDANELSEDGCVNCLISEGWTCGGNPSNCSPPPAPVINSFVASDTSLPGGGGSVTLSWTVERADALFIESDAGEDVGAVIGGYWSVALTQTTTFTLIASNAGGRTSPTAPLR